MFYDVAGYTQEYEDGEYEQHNFENEDDIISNKGSDGGKYT